MTTPSYIWVYYTVYLGITVLYETPQRELRIKILSVSTLIRLSMEMGKVYLHNTHTTVLELCSSKHRKVV